MIIGMMMVTVNCSFIFSPVIDNLFRDGKGHVAFDLYLADCFWPNRSQAWATVPGLSFHNGFLFQFFRCSLGKICWSALFGIWFSPLDWLFPARWREWPLAQLILPEKNCLIFVARQWGRTILILHGVQKLFPPSLPKYERVRTAVMERFYFHPNEV